MRIRTAIGNRHTAKVQAELAPYLRGGEDYRYRGLCYWVQAATGERVTVVYAYLTNQRFLLVDDATRRPVGAAHALDALLDVSRDGEDVVLYFVTDEDSKQAAAVGLRFTSRRLADSFLAFLTYQTGGAS